MKVILGLHILIALSGLILSFYVYMKPSKALVRLCYGLIVVTLTSGAYLVAIGAGKLTPGCISGLIYLAATSAGLVPAKRRLARQSTY